MQILYFIVFLFLLPFFALMAVRFSGFHRLTFIGRAVGVLACFAAIRYFVLPIWTPDAKFWIYVKAILELLTLLGLVCAPTITISAKDGKVSVKAGLFSSLAIRLIFVAGLYMAFYDVISVWPIFGQAWYWAYVLFVNVVVGRLGELWLRHYVSFAIRFVVSVLGLLRLGKKNKSELDWMPVEFGKSCLGCISLVIINLATFIYLVTCIVSSDYRRVTNDRLDNIVFVLREKVLHCMPAFTKKTTGIMALWDKALKKDREILDRRHPQTANVRSRDAIKRSLAELREMLLPFDSRRVLREIRRLDGEIASQRESLADLRERRGLHPEKAEKLDSKIAKAADELASLEAARAEAMEKTRADLKAIGLDFPEKSPFLMVDIGDLIDNAIVAKNTGMVVENLKAIADAEKGNVEAAKRYYGAYIVMLEVQSECFRQYLNKAASGIWRNGIEEVVKNAEAAKKVNELKASSGERSKEERAAFLHAAGTNEKTLKAAQTYLAILKRHEDIVKEKIDAIEKRHEIALSFWESVDIASAFTSRISSDMADFEALLELKLPAIAFFDDVAMQAEFDAITQKFMKE